MKTGRTTREQRNMRQQRSPLVAAPVEVTVDKIDGPITRFEKSKRAHVLPRTFGWVKATYSDAIEYTIGPPGARGLLFFWGIFGVTLLVPVFLWMALGIMAREERRLFEYFALLVLSGFVLAPLGILLWCLRLEFFRPIDEPTIFDRKNRKVYRILRDVHPGLRGLFRRWPLRYACYDWDLIDAQHEAKVITTGSTVSRYHALVFLVRQAPNNPNYVDYFTIGNSLVLGETNVAPVWEHIRRFMEENGPHLPPGDVLADADVPHTWWQSMRAVFPASKGDTFWGWLKQELPFAMLLLALFPLTVPMFILWGTGNWLSHKTSTSIRWPDEVQQAVGPVLSKS